MVSAVVWPNVPSCAVHIVHIYTVLLQFSRLAGTVLTGFIQPLEGLWYKLWNRFHRFRAKKASIELTKCINHRVPMEEGCTVPPFPMEDYVCVYIFNQQGSRDVGRAIGLLFFSLTT